MLHWMPPLLPFQDCWSQIELQYLKWQIPHFAYRQAIQYAKYFSDLSYRFADSVVQNDIQGTWRCKCYQWDFGFSDTAKNGGFKIIQKNDRHTKKIDSQIKKRWGKHIFRYMKQFQQRRCYQFPNNCYQYTTENGYYNGGVYCFFHWILVTSTDSSGNNNGDTKSNANK